MKKLSMFMAVTAMLLLSCNSAEKNYNQKPATLQDNSLNGSSGLPEKQRSIAADSAVIDDHEPANALKTKTVATYQDWDKKIIKTAEVTVELKNYAVYNQTIHNGLRAFGAYISAEEQTFRDDRAENTIAIKVPVAQFENLMNSFTGDSVKVLQKKISSEDVTGEVIDTKSRMEAKKQTRDRYLELLKQARNMKEILEVQQEINSIQEEIESAGGRVNYLNHQSAYSTIHLQYFQYLNANCSSGGKNSGYLVQLKEGFLAGISVIGRLFIFIVTIWPLILAGLFVGYFWRRNKAKAARAIKQL